MKAVKRILVMMTVILLTLTVVSAEGVLTDGTRMLLIQTESVTAEPTAEDDGLIEIDDYDTPLGLEQDAFPWQTMTIVLAAMLIAGAVGVGVRKSQKAVALKNIAENIDSVFEE